MIFSELKTNKPIVGRKHADDAGVVISANSSDPHNDTTVSEISADITIDSVRDHTM